MIESLPALIADEVSLDSPGEVAALRRTLVALASIGALGGMGGDETSSLEAVARLRAACAELANSSARSCVADKIRPEELPLPKTSGVEFVRLREVALVEKGKTGIKDAKAGPYPLVVTGEDRLVADHFDFDAAAAIVPLVSSSGHGHASIKRLHYQEGQFALGTILCAIVPAHEGLLSARFVFEYLSAFKDKLLVSKMFGTANVSLSLGKVADVPVPVPAPCVQRSFIQLMELCDELEAAQVERESSRDRFVASSLYQLAAVEPGDAINEVESHVAAALIDGLPQATRSRRHMKSLRRTIAALATRGVLVEQIADEEPASELIKQIHEHRESVRTKQTKAGKVTNGGAVARTARLPAGWALACLGDLVVSRDGERVPVSKAERASRPKVYDYYGASGVIDKIDGYLFDKPLLLIGEDGANLINRSTPIAFIARGEYWVNNHAHVLDGISEDLLRYLELYINATDLSPYVTGTAQPKMNQAKMNSIPVLLPPQLEQKRILEKYSRLIDLVDELEQVTAERELNSTRLIDSVLCHVLTSQPAA